MRLVPNTPQLKLQQGADHRVYVVAPSDNYFLGFKETVASIETEIIEGNVIITVRRIDEAVTGPISVVMV